LEALAIKPKIKRFMILLLAVEKKRASRHPGQTFTDVEMGQSERRKGGPTSKRRVIPQPVVMAQSNKKECDSGMAVCQQKSSESSDNSGPAGRHQGHPDP
jgi:hypothetical protein